MIFSGNNSLPSSVIIIIIIIFFTISDKIGICGGRYDSWFKSTVFYIAQSPLFV